MKEPRWLSRLIIDVIHSELLAEHNGAAGARGGGDVLIESTLERTRNQLAYDESADLASLSAAYLCGLTKNHGYVDGNKRVGFANAATFLRLNGQRLTASEVEAYDAVIGVVENLYSEAELAIWIREHLESIS